MALAKIMDAKVVRVAPTRVNEWVVYMLCCSDETLYTGVTNNLQRRIDQHNRGVGAKYTRGRTPVTLVHQWKCADRSSALKLEFRLKRMSRSTKLLLVTEPRQSTISCRTLDTNSMS